MKEEFFIKQFKSKYIGDDGAVIDREKEEGRKKLLQVIRFLRIFISKEIGLV